MTRLVTVLNESRVKEVADLRAILRKRGVSMRSLNKALRTMLEYFGEKEQDDFFEADHTAPIRNHIYGSMVIVDEYLKGRR